MAISALAIFGPAFKQPVQILRFHAQRVNLVSENY
jgi:hypothetical protein